MASIVAWSRSMSEALTLSKTCSGRDAPMIAEATSGRRRTHASAICAGVIPRPSAIGSSSWTAASARSSRRFLMNVDGHRVARRARVGRRRLARLVLAGQHALGQRRPHDLRDAVLLAQREDLALRSAPQRAVLRLRGHELDRALDVEAGLDLLRVPLREADRPRLTGAHDLAERLHRLLDRDARVRAVALVQVDVVGLQAFQRRVDLLGDLVGAEPAVAVGHREVHLGRQDVGVARVVLQDLTPRGLRRAGPVDVGRVEERDPGLERGLGARLGGVAFDAARVRQPRAEGDGADLDVGVAEVAEAHPSGLPRQRSRNPSSPATAASCALSNGA